MIDNYTYKIVLFRLGKPSRDIRHGLTLEEAQAHCRREDTHGKDWFHGYTRE